MQTAKWHIYTGDGKGKTTAAIGLAARAIGQGLQVVFFQFLKHGGGGEHNALARLGVLIDSGSSVGGPPWNEQYQQAWAHHSREQWRKIVALPLEQTDLIVLDEILIACRKEHLDVQEISHWASQALSAGCELVMTGRNAPSKLLAQADLVTEMKEIKHYLDQGVAARPGIEY